jgi:hypothetical protein
MGQNRGNFWAICGPFGDITMALWGVFLGDFDVQDCVSSHLESDNWSYKSVNLLIGKTSIIIKYYKHSWDKMGFFFMMDFWACLGRENFQVEATSEGVNLGPTDSCPWRIFLAMGIVHRFHGWRGWWNVILTLLKYEASKGGIINHPISYWYWWYWWYWWSLLVSWFI